MQNINNMTIRAVTKDWLWLMFSALQLVCVGVWGQVKQQDLWHGGLPNTAVHGKHSAIIGSAVCCPRCAYHWSHRHTSGTPGSLPHRVVPVPGWHPWLVMKKDSNLSSKYNKKSYIFSLEMSWTCVRIIPTLQVLFHKNEHSYIDKGMNNWWKLFLGKTDNCIWSQTTAFKILPLDTNRQRDNNEQNTIPQNKAPLTWLPCHMLEREVIEVKDAALLIDGVAELLGLLCHVPPRSLQHPDSVANVIGLLHAGQ